jgi:hypothetical protein
VSGHEFRCEPDGQWFLPWCTCGWTGLLEAFRSHALSQWMEHETEAHREAQPETSREEP